MNDSDYIYSRFLIRFKYNDNDENQESLELEEGLDSKNKKSESKRSMKRWNTESTRIDISKRAYIHMYVCT